MAKPLDISAAQRIEIFTGLLERIGRVSDPWEAIDAFSDGMGQAYGPVAALHLSTRGLGVGDFRLTRFRTPDGVDHVPPRVAWEDHTLPVRRGGVLAEVVTARRPCVLQDLDLAADPVLAGVLGHYRSLMAAPVFDPELPVSWVILLSDQPRYFTAEKLEQQLLHTNLLGAIVKGLRTSQQLEAANLRIAREIEQIARIQRTLLPAELPQIPGLTIAAHYETFDRAGGDLYDFAFMEGDPATTEDDRWAMLIADASGHGPAAATVCAIVHSILHAYPREPGGPAELLRHVNEHLCAKRIESSFVTAFLAFYRPATRELVCARAGHNPPLLISACDSNDGSRRCVQRVLDEANGLPLGIDADAPFTEQRLTLATGQMLVLYTDGITEARDAAGEEFGPEGVGRALAGCPRGAGEAVNRLIKALENFQGQTDASDDRTIVVVEMV